MGRWSVVWDSIDLQTNRRVNVWIYRAAIDSKLGHQALADWVASTNDYLTRKRDDDFSHHSWQQTSEGGQSDRPLLENRSKARQSRSVEERIISGGIESINDRRLEAGNMLRSRVGVSISSVGTERGGSSVKRQFSESNKGAPKIDSSDDDESELSEPLFCVKDFNCLENSHEMMIRAIHATTTSQQSTSSVRHFS